MANNSSDVLSQSRILSSAVIEMEDGANGFVRIAAFKNANVNFNRQSTTLTATDDAQFAGQRLRDDLQITGDFLAPRSFFWLSKVFDLDESAATYGASINVAAEETITTYKKGAGGIYEALLQNSHRDGSTAATVNSVDIIDEDGTVITAGIALGTDYEVGLNSGYTTITAVAGGAIATASDPTQVRLRVDYDYEPLVTVKFKGGASKIPASKRFRITEVPSPSTSVAEQPHYMVITLQESIVPTGFQFQFADQAGQNDPFEMPVTIQNSEGIEYDVDIVAR